MLVLQLANLVETATAKDYFVRFPRERSKAAKFATECYLIKG